VQAPFELHILPSILHGAGLGSGEAEVSPAQSKHLRSSGYCSTYPCFFSWQFSDIAIRRILGLAHALTTEHWFPIGFMAVEVQGGGNATAELTDLQAVHQLLLQLKLSCVALKRGCSSKARTDCEEAAVALEACVASQPPALRRALAQVRINAL
jgi:hypothetical protein